MTQNVVLTSMTMTTWPSYSTLPVLTMKNPIAGLYTDQYQTIVDTDASGKETADTDNASAAGSTEPTGVVASTEGDSEDEDEDDVEATGRRQEEKNS